MNVAVLFLVFNRPRTTAQVFAAIRAARPARLYVAADGPRTSAEAAQCEAVRNIATQVDWPCEVRTLFRDRNLGCRAAVTQALSWFFGEEEAGIILEDDCLPDASFFGYCEELLERYHGDSRVLSIGGSNFQGGRQYGNESYFATKHFHCWGWASWRRAWREYDADLSGVAATLGEGLRKLQDGSSAFPHYWMQVYRDCLAGRYSSWSYPMTLTCFARVGAGRETLHLAPQVNLVANIGFDASGTHVSANDVNHAPFAGKVSLPLVHPDRLVRNAEADAVTDRTHYCIGWSSLVKDRLVQAFPRLHRTWRRARAWR